MKKLMIILCSIYAGSSLAEPISLLCIGGEIKKEKYALYIDIEANEMLYRGLDKKYFIGKEGWKVLEDMKADRVSVSGKEFFVDVGIEDKEIYHKFTVDRTDLEMKITFHLYDEDTEEIFKGKCEISDFDIETAF